MVTITKFLPLALTLLGVSADKDLVRPHRRATAVGQDLDVIFVIDGSGSIDDNDWAIQKNGFISALQDPNYMVVDGTVAVGVVQFSTEVDTVLDLTLVNTESDLQVVIDAINGMVQMKNLTATSLGLYRANSNFKANARDGAHHHICLATDGKLNYGPSIDGALYWATDADYKLDSLSVLAMEDPYKNFYADTAEEYFTPYVFGDMGHFTVVADATEFAALAGYACLPSRVPTGAPSGTPSMAPTPPGNGRTPRNGGGYGDPHFKTWAGDTYDFHGGCDLVLASSKKFYNGVGIDVHVRTEIRRTWSFISEAAIKIGDEILEIGGFGAHMVNGKKEVLLEEEGFAGFPVTVKSSSEDKRHKYIVHLGKNGGQIIVHVYNEFLAVSIKGAKEDEFGDAIGLMGTFGEGRKIARDGVTEIDDMNAFGIEWQVRDNEPKLFNVPSTAAYPKICPMPSATDDIKSYLRNGYVETDVNGVTRAEAEKACESWKEKKESCIFDVMSTGNIELAEVGAIMEANAF